MPKLVDTVFQLLLSAIGIWLTLIVYVIWKAGRSES
jgi:hypothetical protein